MLRAIGCLALVGCVTIHEPPQAAEEATSRVVQIAGPLWPRTPPFDVVIAIDHSAAVQPYRARLAEQLPRFAEALQQRLPDAHVAVLAPDGTLATDAAVDGDFIVHGRRTDGSLVRNYEGELRDVVMRMAALDVVTDEAPTPLADVADVLAAHPRFVRRDARLRVIVFAADDDHSPDAVTTYLERIEASHRDRWSTISVASPCTAAPRLAAVVERYADDGARTARMCDGELAELAPGVAIPLPLPCIEGPLLDTDDAAPGVQATCAAELDAGGSTQALPSCLDGRGAPCWFLEEHSEDECHTGLSFEVMAPLIDLPQGSYVRAQCLRAP